MIEDMEDNKVKKEVKIIETRFFNKKANKEIKQFLVKIPKKIVEKFEISKENKIEFKISLDNNKNRVLQMRLI
ncbi:hypothetical protein HQ533_03685 [Candidatus Woesearchaeota archaeon]|nr:hypothetical protein [Candidatus Woesearchaeota archaeon]